MQRILQNILMNSIIHNPPNTDIYTHIFDADQSIEIHIVDNGVGMSSDLKDNIFQQYYRGTTTDASSEGTGLGMAIVHNLIQAHRGTISIESELAKGTTFILHYQKNNKITSHILEVIFYNFNTTFVFCGQPALLITKVHKE